jgi:hypothetical protein
MRLGTKCQREYCSRETRDFPWDARCEVKMEEIEEWEEGEERKKREKSGRE